MNKFNNHNQQSLAESPNNTLNLKNYLIHSYISSRSVKLGKGIAALMRDRLGIDIKIAYQTIKIIL